MKLHELKYNDGAVKNANRVGRGTSSGNGKTSGRGQKGQNSRIHYSEKYQKEDLTIIISKLNMQ